MVTKTKPRVQPLADRVLVRPEERSEARRKGGIIIPDTAKEKPQEGIVLAVGPGSLDKEGKRLLMDVKKGDRVLFGKYSGTEIRVDDEDLLIVREADILGKV